MIKSAASTAAKLPLAPARLAGRITGSLMSKLRGSGGPDAQPATSARTSRPSRTRAKARPKRASTGTQAKARPKRAATGTRAKARPKRAATGTRAKARPKRAATGTRAKARPKRAARPKPLDDPAIARKVESTIFGHLGVDKREVDVDVDQGVVTLGGNVGTPDLIQELEARATRITEVRRVENRLRVAATSPRTDMPPRQPKPGRFQRPGPKDHALVSADTSEETATTAAADRSEAVAAGGQAQFARATGGMDSAGDRAQEATEKRAAHEATEERKAREAAERGPAQEAVSDSGAATRAAEALTEGGAADTAAKAAPEAAAIPKNVTGKAADAAKGVAGEVSDATKKVSGDISSRPKNPETVDDDESTADGPPREGP
jgi:osmotically-inducible protein OsmY